MTARRWAITWIFLINAVSVSPLWACQPALPVQWLYTRLVPAAYTDPQNPASGGRLIIGRKAGESTLGVLPADHPGPADLYGDSPHSWLSERLPYRVPDGHWLALTDVFLSSKQLTLRNSYFLLYNIVSVPSAAPHWSPRLPIILPPGAPVIGELLNNSPESQWMVVAMQGVLLPVLAIDDYHAAARRALRALHGDDECA